MSRLKRKYHGWLVVEAGGPEMKDYFTAEFTDEKGVRHRIGGPDRYNQWRDPVPAIEWWDKKVGKEVKLEPMLKGSYRVYTEVETEA